MNNRILLIITYLLMNTFIVGCQKDDLCDGSQPTIPRMQVSFVDIANTQESKPVASIAVTTTLNTDVPLDESGSLSLSNVSAISLPLNPNSNQIEYVFKVDDGSTISTDTIMVTYTLKEIYINRACGYLLNFENLDASLIPGNSPWIINEEVVNNSINNNEDIHLEIRH